MANRINIMAQLEGAKPIIELGEGEAYEINDDKNILLQADQFMKSDDNENELNKLNQLFELLLGKDQVKQIEKNHPGITTRISQMKVLLIGIMAAIHGETYEEMAKSFR